MRSFEGNVGRINAVTAKNLFIWLEKHNIDFDEIHFGKPWCGINGFYIDDRAIRPSEFLKYSFEDLTKILEKESKL
jgi:capsule biosynthesis phosphatase